MATRSARLSARSARIVSRLVSTIGQRLSTIGQRLSTLACTLPPYLLVTCPLGTRTDLENRRSSLLQLPVLRPVASQASKELGRLHRMTLLRMLDALMLTLWTRCVRWLV